jgi:peptidyl-prolyl cis-trans isomerase C
MILRTPVFFRRALTIGAAAGALVMAAGCSKSSGGEMNFRHNRDGKGTSVATFGKDSITVEELNERFAEMSPFARARFQTVEERKQYVEGLARFELLAAEALARGLQNDPEVIGTAKKVMVQKLIQSEFDEKGAPISDAEIAEYYDKHKADYVKPEMVRLSHIFLAAPEGDASRAAKKVKAEALLKSARALQPLDYSAFGQLVSENTEDEKTKPLRGDMRYLSQEDLLAQHGAEIAEAAKSLTQMGQVSEVVATPKGFHILKLQARQAPLNLTVDQVRAQIQSRLLYERRAERFGKFVEELKKKNGFKIHDEPLAKMELDLKAPAKDTKRPPPGYIPPVAGPPVQ